MDGRKPPKLLAVKGAVHPVTDKVADYEDGDSLRPQGQPCCRAEAVLKQIAIESSVDEHGKRYRDGSDAYSRDSLRYERGEQPIRGVGCQFAAKDRKSPSRPRNSSSIARKTTSRMTKANPIPASVDADVPKAQRLN